MKEKKKNAKKTVVSPPHTQATAAAALASRPRDQQRRRNERRRRESGRAPPLPQGPPPPAPRPRAHPRRGSRHAPPAPGGAHGRDGRLVRTERRMRERESIDALVFSLSLVESIALSLRSPLSRAFALVSTSSSRGDSVKEVRREKLCYEARERARARETIHECTSKENEREQEKKTVVFLPRPKKEERRTQLAPLSLSQPPSQPLSLSLPLSQPLSLSFSLSL